ncbi:MAG TPA: low molecular weight phosphatase family protein [Acidimicrobiia bacterium]|nr:low molecular weight phosphatase family protein [Acidimicrobiia bacterium]
MDHVLFVCTGNLCRSPIAEALLRARLAGHAEDVLVTSAGTMAFASSATSDAELVAAEMGGDLSDHRARRLDPGLVESADLIIAMTADHVIDILHQAPSAAPRVFKLTELARLAASTPRGDGESVREWAHRLGGHRSKRPWADSRDDRDVADPMGETVDFYRATAREIDALLAEVVAGGWPH